MPAEDYHAPRAVSVVKKAGERMHLELMEGSGCSIIVKAISDTSPLAGQIFAGDRILSMNGISAAELPAPKMARAMVAFGDDVESARPLVLEVITPVAKTSSTFGFISLPSKTAKASRHSIAASQAKLLAEAAARNAHMKLISHEYDL